MFTAVAVGLFVNLVLAFVGVRVRALDLSGAVAGVVLGTVVYAALGPAGFVVMVAFVVLGVGTTKLGHGVKAAHGLAQEKGGRRSARHALANAGVAATAALFAATTGEVLYVAAFVGAFAAATADTLSSELGQLASGSGLWGRCVLVTTWREVPRGTDGGISLAGTLAGLGGALLIALTAWAGGLVNASGVAVVVLAGAVGNLADSVLGATLERSGLLDNEGVNFLGTLTGALSCVVLAALQTGL